MKNLPKITLIAVLFFNLIQSADSHQQNNLGKRFIAGFGQGAVCAPMTPVFLYMGAILSPLIVYNKCSDFDKWGKSHDVRLKASKPAGDRAQFSGQVVGYLSVGFIILKKYPLARILSVLRKI